MVVRPLAVSKPVLVLRPLGRKRLVVSKPVLVLDPLGVRPLVVRRLMASRPVLVLKPPTAAKPLVILTNRPQVPGWLVAARTSCGPALSEKFRAHQRL